MEERKNNSETKGEKVINSCFHFFHLNVFGVNSKLNKIHDLLVAINAFGRIKSFNPVTFFNFLVFINVFAISCLLLTMYI